MLSGEERAAAALVASGIKHSIVHHGPVTSLEEAADARGLRPHQVLKTIVVRRGDDDYLFVLVPGDRQISWPKLRRLLDVKRLSLPDAATALEVTGYERGTITPFGSLHEWPVIADTTIRGTVSIGGGGHGVSATLNAKSLVKVLRAQTSDVTDPRS